MGIGGMGPNCGCLLYSPYADTLKIRACQGPTPLIFRLVFSQRLHQEGFGGKARVSADEETVQKSAVSEVAWPRRVQALEEVEWLSQILLGEQWC